MEQLGHFHLFFTLSCAEMKWSEVHAAILHTIGEKIMYEKGWENVSEIGDMNKMIDIFS